MFEIIYAMPAAPQDLEFLVKRLDEHSLEFAEIPPAERFSFFIYDEEKKPIAGIGGAIFYGATFLNLLWVDPKMRNQKYGTRLVQEVENMAREKKCGMVCIRTMTWQALDFYKKLGYFVEMQQQGFIHDTCMYYLRKNM